MTLWVGIGIAAVAIIVIIAVALSGSSSNATVLPHQPPERKVTKDTPPPPPPPAADTPARQALASARRYAREHPEDLFGQLRQFEDLTLQADKSDAGSEARKEAQVIRSRAREAIERALASLDQALAGPIGREEFGAAYDLLETAKARMEWPEWKLSVDQKAVNVREKLDALFEPLKSKATEAKMKGDGATVDSAVSRVRSWGVRRVADDLANALSGVAAAPVRVLLQDFEGQPTGWGYVGGQEFPGAKGGANVDSSVAHGGGRSYKLQADFSGGGAYVGLWCDFSSLKNRDIQEIRLWVKTSTIVNLGVRLSDNSDQCHQKNGGVTLRRSTDWQELVLRVRDLVGGEHWGGANDGRWHGPAKGFGLNIGKGGFATPGATQGVLWIDDVEAVIVPSEDR
jgi:hypothetical protein